MSDLEITCLDAILCNSCGQICGNDVDLGYNNEYECCEECISVVQTTIEAHIEYKNDCRSLLM